MIRPPKIRIVGENRRPTRRSYESRIRPQCEPLEGRALLSLFRGAVDNFAGGLTTAVAVGDFNNDGNLDLVTASANQVSLMLGNGNGTFEGYKQFQVGGGPPGVAVIGSGPEGIAVGDFNGDDNLDVVTANHYTNNVSLLLGDGHGSFQPAQNFAVGSGPEGIAVGDLTGNGIPDVVTANSNDNTVSILMGDGHGSFQPAYSLPAGSQPDAVAIADLNRDGKPDLVVADAGSNSVTVLSNNGQGGFTTSATYKVGRRRPRWLSATSTTTDGSTS